MKALDFTSIILGILTFVNGFGWFFDRTIAQRLRNDVNELRNELNQMKDVLHKIQVCPYLAECPVLGELLEQQKDE